MVSVKTKFDEIEGAPVDFHDYDIQKPSWKHIEKAPEPYWDTKDVIGAKRGLSPEPSLRKEDEPQRRGLLARGLYHFKRFWKLYLIAGVIFLAIFLPLFFLKIIPAIAQRLVDNTHLPIYSAQIFSPTPTSVQYSLSAALKLPAGITVDLKPITLNLYSNTSKPSDPYLRANLPEYHLKGYSQINITNQTTEILDEKQFTDFLTDAVYGDEFELSAEGATLAYLGILKIPIKLQKTIKLTGLNELKGFSFQEAAIVFPPLADGTNLKGTVILPNPSIVSFELGNVTLNMLIGNLTIGSGRLNNVVLYPGNNTVPIQATVDIKTALANLPTILATESDSLVSGNVVVSASGNSTIVNGQHIPYYETVLNKLVITGEVPLVKILTDSFQEEFGGNSSLSGLLNGLLGSGSGSGNASNLLGSLLGGFNLNSSSGLGGALTNLLNTAKNITA